jgi:D-alanyl-D-alanine carboxypeptidase
MLIFTLGCAEPAASPPSDDAATSDVGAADAGHSDVTAPRSTEPPGDVSARFTSQTELAIVNLGLPGVAIAAANVTDGWVWSGTAGAVEPGGEPWTPGHQFRIGSVTKTFTAAAVLLLVDEGRLSLDDSLERWVPGYYDNQGVTVRHLITNSSGIVSYNYVGSFDSTRAWTPVQLVEWAVQHGPTVQFEPGSTWEYSNTNFVLLGLVIEAVTGGTYEDFVTRRFVEPLDLRDTYVAGAGDDNANIVPSFDADGAPLWADPSMGWAAGSIVSTPGDLVRWGAALYGGQVLSHEMLDRMTQPTQVVSDGELYGMGAFIEGEGSERTVGHTGGIAGYLTYMYYLESESTVVVLMTNVLGTRLRELAAYPWSVVLGVEYP